MRSIVVGQIQANQGIQQINVWFRFPVIAARQAYYTNSGFQPAAPGDYAAADAAEITALRNGTFVERPGFFDVIDPAATLATIQARLVSIYTTASTAFKTADDASLARWSSAWDGTTWTMKSS